jgi:hypothetical protein
MTKFARLVLVLFLVASWAAAQSAAPAAADDKSTKDAPAAAEHKHGDAAAMSCPCCKDMAKKGAENKDGMKAEAMDCCAKMGKDKDAAGMCAKMDKDKDAAGGMCAKMDKDKDAAGMCAKMEKDKNAAGGMDCCAKMAAGGGMGCGKKDDAAKPETPEQKMK